MFSEVLIALHSPCHEYSVNMQILLHTEPAQ